MSEKCPPKPESDVIFTYKSLRISLKNLALKKSRSLKEFSLKIGLSLGLEKIGRKKYRYRSRKIMS